MKKRYSDPLCYAAMMLTGEGEQTGPTLNGSQEGDWTGGDENYGRFLGLNGDGVQGSALGMNGSGVQDGTTGDVQLLGETIDKQITKEAEKSTLDEITGETGGEASDAPGTEIE